MSQTVVEELQYKHDTSVNVYVLLIAHKVSSFEAPPAIATPAVNCGRFGDEFVCQIIRVNVQSCCGIVEEEKGSSQPGYEEEVKGFLDYLHNQGSRRTTSIANNESGSVLIYRTGATERSIK